MALLSPAGTAGCDWGTIKNDEIAGEERKQVNLWKGMSMEDGVGKRGRRP